MIIKFFIIQLIDFINFMMIEDKVFFVKKKN